MLMLLMLGMSTAGAQQLDLQGSYEIHVMPDTVDLAHTADLAINAITRCTNPENNYAVYFHGNPLLSSDTT